MQEKTRRFQALVSTEDVLYPGAGRASAAGNDWPLAIASGALRHEIELMLTGGGLLPAFRFIVAAGDTEKKPAPDPYLRAAELLGVAAGRVRRHRGLALGPPIRAYCRHDGPSGSLTPIPRDALRDADPIVDSLDELTSESHQTETDARRG